MFTGPAPGIGKSFVVANFGAILALSGKRVVVIDADLRKGLLHQYFSVEGKPGLSDYVISDADQSAIIRQSSVPGLHLIGRGSIPPNPAELLRHDRFSSLIRQLSSDYDHVLIDTPPMLAVTDAAIVGRLAAATILVLKSAVHPAREIEETLKRLASGGVKVDGAVINQVGLQLGSYGFGNYGYKYYRYED
jgi:tyrosine-protein kinase Etk/Wzc